VRQLYRGAVFSILAGACAIAGESLASPGEPARDPIRTEIRGDFMELTWSDAEDRILGSVTPAYPRAGEPLRFALDIGTYQGAPYRGPVVVALRRSDETTEETRTVAFDGKGWNAEFVPSEGGQYAFDVSFRTTHYKAVHGTLSISETRVPRIILWILVAAASAGALAYGLRLALKKDKTPPPKPT
jgi:hypothetical protein